MAPMLFGECYERQRGRRPVLSFEVFPPRTEAAQASFKKVVPELLALGPDFITVTYGALGSTRDQTIEIAAGIQRDHGIATASHLTCVGASAADIDATLERIEALGIRNLVALRGDPPQGETRFQVAAGGFAHAADLVRHIRGGRRGFGLAVAGYPEKHIEAPDARTDLLHLRDKVIAGADLVITNLFFDNAFYFDFVQRCRGLGIACPIVPGLMPILSRAQIHKITSLCGASIPAALRAQLDAAGDDADAAFEIGIRQAAEQARELLERGAPGIHFYVLNRSSHIRRILAGLPPGLLGHAAG